MSPVNPDYLYVSFMKLGGNHPFYSHDGCNSWQEPTKLDRGDLMFDVNFSPGGEFWSTPIATSPVDEDIAITSGNGNHIEKTQDGGMTWSYSGDGYSGGRVSSFSWDPNDPDRFAFFLTDFGAVLTQDRGSTFKNLKTGRYNEAMATPAGAIDPTPDSKVIVVAAGSNDLADLAVSRDEGETWEFVQGTTDAYFYIVFHPQNTDIIYAGKYKSTDKGKTWNEISKKIIAVFQGNGDIVYAVDVTSEGSILLKSKDGENTWAQPYRTINSLNVKEVVIDPENQDRIYIATLWTGVLIWDGSQWLQTSAEKGFTKDQYGSFSTAAIAIDPNHPNIVYAGRWIGFRGHANGIFRSTDYGETWENITYNLGPEFSIDDISINPHDGYVYIGSSHGTWRLPPPDISMDK